MCVVGASPKYRERGLMGCHSHGPVSTKMKRTVDQLSRADLEMFVFALTDMQFSDIPEWADYDWWRQTAIDWAARQAGELPEPPSRGQAPSTGSEDR